MEARGTTSFRMKLHLLDLIFGEWKLSKHRKCLTEVISCRLCIGHTELHIRETIQTSMCSMCSTSAPKASHLRGSPAPRWPSLSVSFLQSMHERRLFALKKPHQRLLPLAKHCLTTAKRADSCRARLNTTSTTANVSSFTAESPCSTSSILCSKWFQITH